MLGSTITATGERSMGRNPHVYDLANRHGADQRVVMRMLRELGEYVKSPSSTLVPPVARKLAAALTAEGYFAPALPKLESAAGILQDLPHSALSVLSVLGDGDHGFNKRLRLAAEDRTLYYLSGPAAQQIVSTEASGTPVSISPEKLHTRTGVLIVQPSPDEGSVYAWIADEDALRFQTLRLTETAEDHALTPSHLRSVDIPATDTGYESAMTQFGQFCSVWDLVPEGTPHQSSSAGAGTPRSTKRRAGRPDDDYVRMSALTRIRTSPVQTERGFRASQPATYRWTVRGHYREQPYPSLGITKRIWIESHSAGARDGELVTGLRVFVISP